nr:hypothetical protein [Chenggangzhangella methanolivorans]
MRDAPHERAGARGQRLSIRYPGAAPVIADLDLAVAPGEIVAGSARAASASRAFFGCSAGSSAQAPAACSRAASR